jgi:hypothetical protein
MRNEGLINGLPLAIKKRTDLRVSRAPNRKPAKLYALSLAVFVAIVLLSVGSYLAVFQRAGDHGASALAPPSPYILYGYTYDGAGNPIGSVDLAIVDIRTTDTEKMVSDGDGYYQFDLANLPSGYSAGDTISIVGNTTQYSGHNSTAVTGSGGKWFNVTLDVVIPEFSSVIFPIGATMVILSLVPTIRRKFRK